MTSEIQRLSDDSIRRIVAEQAISDLSSVVKELVDNALDAESNTIKIRLFGQGLDIIEVSDDGTGVPPMSRPQLATRYATSKISSFSDIYSGTGLTMGFRGEALFSMACVSQNLVVATRTEDEEMAQKMNFKRDGRLNPLSLESLHRKIGTTVAVIKPFAALPARRADLTRRIKAERAKLFRLLEAYAIFNVGTQINLIDITQSDREDVALATSASSTTMEETVSSVLGHKCLSSLESIEIDLSDVIQREAADSSCRWQIKGLVSKQPQTPASGRSVNYYCINGRVVDLPQMTRILRKIWNGFGGKKKPSSLLSFTLPNDAFDINLSPDKQQVLLTHENELCRLLDEQVTQFWSNETSGVFNANSISADPVEEEISISEQRASPQSEAGSATREKSPHKRRFAFVNDLYSAKLQHDSEERQPSWSSRSQSSTAPVGLETALQEDPITRTSTARNDDDDRNHASDGDKRRWQEVQAQFSGADDQDPQSSPMLKTLPRQISSHTDGDFGLEEESAHQDGMSRRQDDAQVQLFRSEGDTEKTSPTATRPLPRQVSSTIDDESMRSTPQQTSLAQFAFTKTSGESSTPSTMASTPGSTSSRKRARPGDMVEGTPQQETSSVDCEAAVSSTKKQRRSEEADHRTPDGRDKTAPDSRETSTPTGTPISESDSSSHGEDSSKSAVATVWSFGGTTAICELARKSRVKARKRTSQLDLLQKATKSKEEAAKTDGGGDNLVSSSIEEQPTVVTLSRSIFKGGMEVIGQFNFGFIIARDNKNDLWILDQHACDEKHNFERLCRETKIHEQRLLKPMPLDLCPSEEACILDHMEVFEANGFRFNFDPEAPVRKRLSLTALPHSGAADGRKAVQFDKEDVSALCAILSEGSSYDAGSGGTGTDGQGKYGNNAVRRYASTGSTTSQRNSTDRMVARLPKAIAMFASRACRTSIMIGKALSKKEMEQIVLRLSEIDNPWNCPHGRPTMRHVGNILPHLRKDERRFAESQAEPTTNILPQASQEMLALSQVNS